MQLEAEHSQIVYLAEIVVDNDRVQITFHSSV